MCCILAALFAFGPRAAILIWWLVEPFRWQQTFDTFLWPLAGFLVAPWTTLMFVLVFPAGINGFDYVVRTLEWMDAKDLDWVDVRPDVEARYNEQLQHDLDTIGVWAAGGCAGSNT